MRMIDLIIKKRDGHPHTDEEMAFIVKSIVDNSIPDYQISAWLMAVVLRGMNEHETSQLTLTMMHSGDTINLDNIQGITVDKHSTGGVGDKTSLALGPMVAACGVKVAKMSGRGLGHTGGTLDKLEAIPGVRIDLAKDQFIKQINTIGLAIIGQTGRLVPADKKLYALRDVTGTVESLPLIAASIMSKKLASGANTILLDVKFGSGAFMKSFDDAKKLAKTMVAIGRKLNRDVRAIITDMQQPLGLAVGNNLEVIEAINTLKGHGPQDFQQLCIEAGAIMLMQAKVSHSIDEAKLMVKQSIENGSAYDKLKQMIEMQGGDITYLEHPDKFKAAKHIIPIYATRSGYINQIDALMIGEAAMKLGAGRESKDDLIDYSAGIILNKKVADFAAEGDILAYLHTNRENYQSLINDVGDAFRFTDQVVEVAPIIYDYIS